MKQSLQYFGGFVLCSGAIQQMGTYIWQLEYTDANGKNCMMRGKALLVE